MENLLKKIEELRERFLKIRLLLDIDGQITESREKKRLMSDSGFWNDREQAVVIGKRVEELDSEIKRWDDMEKGISDLEALVALAQEEGDDSFYDESLIKYDELLQQFNDLEFLALFSDKYDPSNVILSIHAGTGGVDAQDWASILERMYLRFAEQKKYTVEIIDHNAGTEAGIKSVSMRITGRFAYGYLKSENGMHRLVRISPFDSESMRHTSFALVEVIPELPETEDVIIKDDDLRIDFYHSSGPGGQNVNKTSSAVRLVHLPTNIIVTCQSERSQHQNREIAMKVLKARLHHLEQEKRGQEEKQLKGETQKAGWGKQIRSYVMQPYQLVKDHRTDHETTEIDKVLNGDLTGFMEAYLRWLKK
ncbi:peptide chain release factor 2 [Candidatus Falkowbacteria bacterium CG10_big_fil_rev_8_21_14_0_10_39_9]|uniref:Peptide chain release factor 2 n=1 Tax=Candidatus Falkowbacteria bacterium CG10_big_fil_rev_8_21_14_0_10_39_9 TaxID=1974566 RepID=A0A2M6WNT5_9BACT|nr:MAG: peptide chain release factor 2 [Candidatus Falkowbacteria bacterium CG10_big_fil_rev_8_21_14_0_10_39_9]